MILSNERDNKMENILVDETFLLLILWNRKQYRSWNFLIIRLSNGKHYQNDPLALKFTIQCKSFSLMRLSLQWNYELERVIIIQTSSLMRLWNIKCTQ